MNPNQNQSYSLLNQEEIDVLVNFLTDKKNSVHSDVMSQQSIDKLIYLITNDRQQLMNILDPLVCVDPELLEHNGFRQNEDELCELRCTVADNGYLKLTAHNTVSDSYLEITPALFSANDTEDWGKCISPMTFNRLAKALHLRYTTETHKTICSVYAKTIFGDENHPVSSIHLPTKSGLLEVLM